MKEKKIPMRKCAGCMKSREKGDLIRLAGYEGKISVDLTGRARGRGVYLCRDNPECWEKAYKRKSIERALDINLSTEERDKLFEELKETAGE